MRGALCGIAFIVSVATFASAQPPNQGGFNNQGVAPGQGGPNVLGGPGAIMGPPPNAMFNTIDADGDGTITKAELRKAVNALKKLDADGDGNITLAEVSPPGGPMGDPAQFVDRLMQGDINGDGLLSGNELQGPMANRLLQQGDRNQDGALDRNEITAAMQNMVNQGPGGPNWNAAGGAALRGGQVGGNFDPQQMTGRLMQFDENRDGKLSPDEVPQESKRFLNNADQDGDGFLSPAELQVVNERMGERIRGAQARGFRGRGVPDGAGRSGQNRQQPGTP